MELEIALRTLKYLAIGIGCIGAVIGATILCQIWLGDGRYITGLFVLAAAWIYLYDFARDNIIMERQQQQRVMDVLRSQDD